MSDWSDGLDDGLSGGLDGGAGDFPNISSGDPSFGNDGSMGTNDPSNTGISQGSTTDSAFTQWATQAFKSGIPWSQILQKGLASGVGLAALGSLATGIYSRNQQGDYKNWADQAVKTADPFASQRGQYQTDLANLYKDPSSVQNTPGYKFALSQGLASVANQDSGKFGVGAGSTDVDRMNYAQGLASQTFNTEANRLAQLSGANFGPGDAAKTQQAAMFASANAGNNSFNNFNNAARTIANGGNNGAAGGSVGDMINFIGGGN